MAASAWFWVDELTPDRIARSDRKWFISASPIVCGCRFPWKRTKRRTHATYASSVRTRWCLARTASRTRSRRRGCPARGSTRCGQVRGGSGSGVSTPCGRIPGRIRPQQSCHRHGTGRLLPFLRAGIEVGEQRNAPPLLAKLHELAKALPSGLVLLRAHHPPSGGLAVPRRLRVEERRRRPVLLERRSERRRETIPALLVGVDPGPIFAPGRERLLPRQMHPPGSIELLRPPDVHVAPDAARPARREPDGVSIGVQAPADAVDPADAESLVHRLRPGDARLSRALLVKPDEELFRGGVVLLEPLPQGGRRPEKGWPIRRGRPPSPAGPPEPPPRSLPAPRTRSPARTPGSSASAPPSRARRPAARAFPGRGSPRSPRKSCARGSARGRATARRAAAP